MRSRREEIKILTSEEIGHEDHYPIVKMLLLNPHDHTFWYKRPDGTLYMFHRRKGWDVEDFYTEVDGYQMELKFDVDVKNKKEYNIER